MNDTLQHEDPDRQSRATNRRKDAILSTSQLVQLGAIQPDGIREFLVYADQIETWLATGTIKH